LIAASALATFAAANPTSAVALNHWRTLVKVSDWKTMEDVRSSVSTAKILNADRIRFEIAGGGFRLVASINFRRGTGQLAASETDL
jgi:mRNA interferase HigB